MTSIKKLNEVMRDPKLYAQTKALYSYLWIRADYKTGYTYPPKEQTLSELNLTEGLYIQGIKVLESRGYIIPTTKSMVDANNNPYTINCWLVVGERETKDIQDTKEQAPTKKAKKTSKPKLKEVSANA